MPHKKYLVFDFDSTFVKIEALDELCAIADEDSGTGIANQVRAITDRAMAGELSFEESLRSRVALLDANRSHVDKLIEKLKGLISESIQRNRDFLAANAEDVLIISNGFKDFIVPVVAEYGLKPVNVYANEFRYDEGGKIVGYDEENPLSKTGGKVVQMQRLKLQGDVFVIGDGYTDYQIREAGLADKFYAFTENVSRETVLAKADHVAPSFDEVLYVNKMPMAISYPKSRIKALLLEGVHPKAAERFEAEGYQVETMSRAMDEEELSEAIKGVSILGIRSKTQVTAKTLEKANRLIAVGAFCIGTNQIDLQACSERGVAVFNAPYSNTRSVVELAIGEIVMLMRALPDKIAGMHAGKWLKSAKGSYELRGKKLGIVGYGNIGAQLSVLAEGMGMEVHYYDIVERLALGNAKKCASLDELLKVADVVSLHVDGRADNERVFGAEEIAAMKDGAYLLNLSRGFVVDVPALAEALKSGKLAGAGVDVFPQEPKANGQGFESELRGLPNLILTPHIGGSTVEAQENIGEFVPGKIISYVNTGDTFISVNLPNVQLPQQEGEAHRLLHIHRNRSGLLAQINNALAKHGANISGQYLKTNEQVGYVITDVDKRYDRALIADLKRIENTIKFRVLY